MSDDTNQDDVQPDEQPDQPATPVSEPPAAAAPAVVRLTHAKSEQVLEVTGSLERYLTNGWRIATSEAPKAKASLAAWQDFARSQGFTDEDLAGKTKADLRAALS